MKGGIALVNVPDMGMFILHAFFSGFDEPLLGVSNFGLALLTKKGKTTKFKIYVSYLITANLKL